MAKNAFRKARSQGVVDVLKNQTNIQSYSPKDKSLHFHLHCTASFMSQSSSPVSLVPLSSHLSLFEFRSKRWPAPLVHSHRRYKRSHYDCFLSLLRLSPHDQHLAHCSSYLLSLSFSAKQQLQSHFLRMGNKRMCCFPVDTPIVDSLY